MKWRCCHTGRDSGHRADDESFRGEPGLRSTGCSTEPDSKTRQYRYCTNHECDDRYRAMLLFAPRYDGKRQCHKGKWQSQHRSHSNCEYTQTAQS